MKIGSLITTMGESTTVAAVESLRPGVDEMLTLVDDQADQIHEAERIEAIGVIESRRA